MSQSAYKVPAEAKRALLEHLVRSRDLNQVLCFMRTKHGASRLARQLEKDGLVTDAIHGDKSQQTRMEALAAFKEGKLQVLVATDVAARGLDIDDLPLVVNYELPLRARGLHPPDRPHRARRRLGRGDFLRRARGREVPRRHRAAAEEDGRRSCRPTASTRRRCAPSARRARRAPPRAERPPRAPRAERAPRTPRAEHAARAPRAHGAEDRAARPPREDPRIERERAYALNPDQPPVAPQSDAATAPDSALAPSPALPKRRGFGHGRPVPALLHEAHGDRAREGLSSSGGAAASPRLGDAALPDSARPVALIVAIAARASSREAATDLASARRSAARARSTSMRRWAAASSSATLARFDPRPLAARVRARAADLRPLALRRHRTASAARSRADARPSRSRRAAGRADRALRAEIPLPDLAPRAMRARRRFRSLRLETPDTNDGKELSGLDAGARGAARRRACAERGVLRAADADAAARATRANLHVLLRRRRARLRRRERRAVGEPLDDGHSAAADAAAARRRARR